MAIHHLALEKLVASVITPSYNYSVATQTDSKSKMSKKLIVIWLCCLDYLVYFVKSSICDALLQFNDNPCKLNVSRLNSRN